MHSLHNQKVSALKTVFFQNYLFTLLSLKKMQVQQQLNNYSAQSEIVYIQYIIMQQNANCKSV